METTKDMKVPVSKMISSALVNTNPNLPSFKRLAPNITGMAKKKVNSVATNLDVPTNIPPMIVAPDLEVPGIKDNN